jgi:hypothetical protein
LNAFGAACISIKNHRNAVTAGFERFLRKVSVAERKLSFLKGFSEAA